MSTIQDEDFIKDDRGADAIFGCTLLILSSSLIFRRINFIRDVKEKPRKSPKSPPQSAITEKLNFLILNINFILLKFDPEVTLTIFQLISNIIFICFYQEIPKLDLQGRINFAEAFSEIKIICKKIIKNISLTWSLMQALVSKKVKFCFQVQ
jgi:hypothetical protein